MSTLRGMAAPAALGIDAALTVAATRISRSATAGTANVMLSGVPVGGPLPGVADHVGEPIAIGREAADGSGALKPVARQVLPGKFALPVVSEHLPLRRQLLPPGIGPAVVPTAGGVLPLRFGGNLFAHPRGVSRDVLPGHMQHRVAIASVEIAPRTLRMAPVGARLPVPPGVVAPQRHATQRLLEHDRAGHQHLG